eukprot:SAG11_NODE_22591_length_403_cov_0.891447_1_plen_57_part_10
MTIDVRVNVNVAAAGYTGMWLPLAAGGVTVLTELPDPATRAGMWKQERRFKQVREEI